MADIDKHLFKALWKSLWSQYKCLNWISAAWNDHIWEYKVNASFKPLPKLYCSSTPALAPQLIICCATRSPIWDDSAIWVDESTDDESTDEEQTDADDPQALRNHHNSEDRCSVYNEPLELQDVLNLNLSNGREEADKKEVEDLVRGYNSDSDDLYGSPALDANIYSHLENKEQPPTPSLQPRQPLCFEEEEEEADGHYPVAVRPHYEEEEGDESDDSSPQKYKEESSDVD